MSRTGGCTLLEAAQTSMRDLRSSLPVLDSSDPDSLLSGTKKKIDVDEMQGTMRTKSKER